MLPPWSPRQAGQAGPVQDCFVADAFSARTDRAGSSSLTLPSRRVPPFPGCLVP